MIISESIRWLSYKPNKIVTKYGGYDINGFKFVTKERDVGVHQNSGVCLEADDRHLSNEAVKIQKAFYYGVLQEIWLLDYNVEQVALFKCDWVDKKGVKRDPLGYTSVDLNILNKKTDKFILASQAQQVFYVTDQLNEKMSIVFKTPPRNTEMHMGMKMRNLVP